MQAESVTFQPGTPMSSNWYYARERRRFGPIPLDDLKELVRCRRIVPTDMVLEEGKKKWQEVSSVFNGFSVELKGASSAVLPEGEREKLKGTVAAFAAVPLYMVAVGLILISLLTPVMESSPDAVKHLSQELSHSGSFAKSLGYCIYGFFVCLVGIAVRSVQCIIWIRRDPYRAVAIGRYIFAVYVLLSIGLSLYNEWPRQELMPRVADLHSVTIFMNYLSMLVSTGSDVAEKVALLAFLQGVYVRLRGTRPDYDLDHLLHDW